MLFLYFLVPSLILLFKLGDFLSDLIIEFIEWKL